MLENVHYGASSQAAECPVQSGESKLRDPPLDKYAVK